MEAPPLSPVDVRGRSDFSRFDPPTLAFGPPAERRPFLWSEDLFLRRCLHAIRGSVRLTARAPRAGPPPARPPSRPAATTKERERDWSRYRKKNTTHPENLCVTVLVRRRCLRRARARRVTGNQLHEHSKRRAREHSLSEAPGAPRISHSCHSLPRAGHAGPALSPLDTLSPRCRERSHSSTRVRRTF
jgi:hypothetical protein